MCGGGLTFLFLNPCEIWLHYLATSLSTPFVLSFSSFLPSFLSYSFFLIEKKKKVVVLDCFATLFAILILVTLSTVV